MIQGHSLGCGGLLTTWLMLATFDWRMVTASPIEGFLLATAEALKALEVLLRRV